MLHHGGLVLGTHERRRGAAGHTYVRAVWGFRVRQIFDLGKMICYARDRFCFQLIGKRVFLSLNNASFKQKSHASHMLSNSV